MVTEKTVTKKEDKLCSYEMVVIISPQLMDEQLEAAINNISNFITGKGGVVSEIVRWGKRNLAYPIRHFPSGTYILTRFTLKPSFSKELENILRISEPVLRHLLVKLDSEPAVKPAVPVAQVG